MPVGPRPAGAWGSLALAVAGRYILRFDSVAEGVSGFAERGTIPGRCRSRSETPLPPPEASAAALALEGPAGRGPVAAAPAGATRAEGSRALPARRSVLGGIDRELPSLDLAVVEEPDGLGRLAFGRELDECEPARPTGLTVGGKIHLHDVTGLGEELGEGIRGHAEVQIADEDAGWNG